MLGARDALPGSGYSYTFAGQKRDSGAPYTAYDVSAGTFSMPSLMRRCAGWSPSWLVPERARFVRMSNDSLPSGFGYSIGANPVAGFVAAQSSLPCPCRVHGSRPFKTYAETARERRVGGGRGEEMEKEKDGATGQMGPTARARALGHITKRTPRVRHPRKEAVLEARVIVADGL